MNNTQIDDLNQQRARPDTSQQYNVDPIRPLQNSLPGRFIRPAFIYCITRQPIQSD
ncbi:hypothetical protein HED60_12710 [Planctomycetales bacterium ZRK34]|nr:hypothetical protein HED60_12710 [Planctomycetales bacterium ZRK34]